MGKIKEKIMAQVQSIQYTYRLLGHGLTGPWLTLILASVAAAGAVFLLRGDLRITSSRRLCASAVGVRVAVVLGLAWLVFMPSLYVRKKTTRPGLLLLVVDDSGSMDVPARVTDVSTRLDLAAALEGILLEGRPVTPAELEQRLSSLDEKLSEDVAEIRRMREERQNGLPWSDAQGRSIERMADAWQRSADALAKQLREFRNELVSSSDADAAGEGREEVLSMARQISDVGQQVQRFADALPKGAGTQEAPLDHLRNLTDLGELTGRSLLDAIALTGEVRRQLDADYLAGAGREVRRSVEDVRRLTRRMIARRWAEAAPAVGRLKSKHRVRVLRVSDGREIDADAPSGDQPMTDLRTPLQRILNHYSRDVISGVVLLSDGRHNSGRPLDDVLEGLLGRSIPVHTVTIGSGRPAEDLAIVDYEAPVLARKARPVTITVRLKNTLPEDAPYRLRHREEGRVLTEVALRTQKDKARPVVMRFAPEKAGLHRLIMEVVSEETEDRYPGNDRAVIPLRVAEERLRCLIVADAPTWDLRYMLRALEDMPASARVVSTAGEDPPERGSGEEEVPEEADQWGKNDLIVLAGWPFDGFDAEDARALQQAVEEKGCGLLVLAAPHGGYVEKLADVFGWQPAAGRVEEKLKIDRERMHLPPLEIDPVITEAAAGWRRMSPPGGLSVVPPQHATLLADSGGQPVLSYGIYGSGRVACLGARGLFRMREYEGRPHARRLLENILVTAAWAPFRTDGGHLAVLPGVPVAGRKTLLFARTDKADLTLRPGGNFPVELPALEPGLIGGVVDWPDADEVEISGEDLPAVTIASRRSLTPENVYFAPDEERLRRIAEATGGRHTDFSRLGSAADAVEPDQQVEVEVAQYSLWQHWWFFLALAGLAVTEYVLRRKAGMVL